MYSTKKPIHIETATLSRRDTVEHYMKLYPEPFEMIKRGTKTIELRLNDEKRKTIEVGDDIVFTNTMNDETVKRTVLKLHHFNSFEALYHALPLLKCGYTEKTVDTAKASDMGKYYSLQEQKKYGVVGLELYRSEK